MSATRRPSVLYIVWSEAIWEHVVLTQATEVVCEVQRQGHADVTLLAFLPPVSLFKKRFEFRQTAEMLAQAGVRLRVIVTPLVFTRYLLPRFFLIPLFLAIMVPVVLLLTWRGVDLVHPRGYMAGLAALIVKAVAGCPFVFDPRSPFPEENARIGKWGVQSRDFRLWKWLERRLVRSACCVVATSGPFRDALRRVEPDANLEIIYNNSSHLDGPGTVPAVSRSELGLRSSDLVLAYAGSIGHWNDTGIYAAFHKKMVQIGQDVRLLYIIPELWRRVLVDGFAAEGIASDEYVLVSVRPCEVSAYLSVADAGIQLMLEPDVRLGVKIAEYLTCGLPIIVNQHALGAAALVRDSGVGLVIDLDDEEYPSRVVSFLRSRAARDCRAAAEGIATEFTTRRVAERYGAVYRWAVEGPRQRRAEGR